LKLFAALTVNVLFYQIMMWDKFTKINVIILQNNVMLNIVVCDFLVGTEGSDMAQFCVNFGRR